MIEQILMAVLTGLVSSGLTLVVLKNDIKWMKEILNRHDQRIAYVERKV